MWRDHIFSIALAVSFAAHGVLFLTSPGLQVKVDRTRTGKPLNVQYLALPKPHNNELIPKEPAVKKDPLIKLPEKLGAQKAKLPPLSGDRQLAVNKEQAMASGAMSEQRVAKPTFTRPDIIPVKKRITLSQTDINKNSSPAYLGYSQMCREKVKRAAYQNYTELVEGEVYLTFVVSSEGYLTDVRIFEDKSSANAYLREIALKSIRDASPFAKFPKELDYPQLTFNVVISFETE